jgi:hypothetical protein
MNSSIITSITNIMLRPKDFMGHDLELINDKIHRTDLFCKKCKVRIFPDGSDSYYYSPTGWRKLITCAEVIIKNIIE